jgi:hypothetical protein
MENLTNLNQGKMQWWRFIVGLLIIGLATQIGSIPYFSLLYYQKDQLDLKAEVFDDALRNLDYSILQVHELIALSLALLVFAIAFGLVALSIPKLHKTRIRYFITARSRFDWKRSLVAFSTWFVLLSILIFLFLPKSAYSYNPDIDRFFILVIVAILLVPLQAAFEEVIFRGYLFSGIKLATKSNIITLVITSSLFSLIHAFNPEFEISFWKLFWFYFAAGFAFGIITLADKGIELSVGAHAAYNIFLMIIMSTNDGLIKTPSLFQTTSIQLIEAMPYVLFLVVDISVVVFFVKYKWYKIFEKRLVNNDPQTRNFKPETK